MKNLNKSVIISLLFIGMAQAFDDIDPTNSSYFQDFAQLQRKIQNYEEKKRELKQAKAEGDQTTELRLIMELAADPEYNAYKSGHLHKKQSELSRQLWRENISE